MGEISILSLNYKEKETLGFIKSDTVKKLYLDLLAFCSNLKDFKTEQRNTTKHSFRIIDKDNNIAFSSNHRQ